MKRLLILIFWLVMQALPFSPLVNAAREGDANGIKSLVAKGANPNEPAGAASGRR